LGLVVTNSRNVNRKPMKIYQFFFYEELTIQLEGTGSTKSVPNCFQIVKTKLFRVEANKFVNSRLALVITDSKAGMIVGVVLQS